MTGLSPVPCLLAHRACCIILNVCGSKQCFSNFVPLKESKAFEQCVQLDLRVWLKGAHVQLAFF
eukprot:285629-Pelagomonas_calceolata.AAC.1